MLLTLPAYAEQGLYGGGVRQFVCPIDRQQQRRPTGLLLSALRSENIDR